MKIQDLFTFQERVSRATYALTGIIGTLIKHNIDRVLAMQMYRQKWGLTNYLIPLVVLNRPNPSPPTRNDWVFGLGMSYPLEARTVRTGLTRIASGFFPPESSANRFLRRAKGSTLPLECRKNATAKGVVALWPHPGAASRGPRFQAGTCGFLSHRVAGQADEARWMDDIRESHAARDVLATVDG